MIAKSAETLRVLRILMDFVVFNQKTDFDGNHGFREIFTARRMIHKKCRRLHMCVIHKACYAPYRRMIYLKHRANKPHYYQ